MIIAVLRYVLEVYCLFSYFLVGYLLFREHQEHEYDGSFFEKWGAIVVLFAIAPLVMLHVFWQKLRGPNQPGVM